MASVDGKKKRSTDPPPPPLFPHTYNYYRHTRVQIAPVLQRIATVGCPEFTTSGAWPHDQPLFQACVWAVLGNLANEVHPPRRPPRQNSQAEFDV